MGASARAIPVFLAPGACIETLQLAVRARTLRGAAHPAPPSAACLSSFAENAACVFVAICLLWPEESIWRPLCPSCVFARDGAVTQKGTCIPLPLIPRRAKWRQQGMSKYRRTAHLRRGAHWPERSLHKGRAAVLESWQKALCAAATCAAAALSSSFWGLFQAARWERREERGAGWEEGARSPQVSSTGLSPGV
ncbi:hypothetical protein GQ54DRAFT_92958 [Martensiomyces pterosporus]|nr:hypothetical protein GQ54DRAFT_92958 [Martensiomyces pterosporus]